MNRTLATTTLLALVLAAQAAGAAETPADTFYAGKKIDFLVGSAAGGGYAVYALLLSRHMGKHIPGNPQVIPRMMDGAGSLTAANQLYNRSAHDGTVMGAIFTGAVVEPLIGDRAKARYDSRNFGYVGSSNRESSICIAAKGSGIATWTDLYDKPLIVSAAGWTSSIRQFPAVLKDILGMQFKVINGYPGSKEAVEAVDKGESQGVCGIQWSSFGAAYARWIDDGTVTAFGQITPGAGDPILTSKGIGNIWPAIRDEEQKLVLETIFNQQEFGRPYIVPPGVPAERLETLRRAFDATMLDPDFQADAMRAQLPISPMRGEEVATAVARLYDMPPAIIERARKALE